MRWKMDEEQQSHKMWLTEESAMVLIKQEKAKARAPMEAAVGTAVARAEQRLTSELTMAMRDVRDGRYS